MAFVAVLRVGLEDIDIGYGVGVGVYDTLAVAALRLLGGEAGTTTEAALGRKIVRAWGRGNFVWCGGVDRRES